MSQFDEIFTLKERALSQLEAGVVVSHFSREKPEALNVPLIINIEHSNSEISVRELATALIRRYWSCRTRLNLKCEPYEFYPVKFEDAFAGAFLEHSVTDPSRHGATVEAISNKPFDLERSLWRIGSVSSREQTTTLVLVFHHLVADGTSVARLLDEISSFFLNGHLNVGWFGDRIVQLTKPDRYRRDSDYWAGRMQKLIHRPGSTTFQSGLVNSFGVSETVLILLSQEESSAIEGIAQKTNVSQFVVFLHVVMSILQRHAGDAPVTVGVPINTRDKVAERAVGLFTNVLPVSLELLLHETAEARMRAIMAGIVETILHCSVPFSEILANASLSGNVYRHPVFQTLVNERKLQSRSSENAKLAEEIESPSATRYEMIWTLVFEDGQPSKVQVAYDRALFDESVVSRLAGQLKKLLRHFGVDSRRAVGEIEFLTDTELKWLLVDWNKTDQVIDYAPSICQLLRAVALKRGAATAVQSGNLRISYGELERRADQAARVLREAGVGSDKVVGICLDRTPDLVTLILAVWKAGGAYLPLDANYPPARLEFILRDAEVHLVLTEERYRDLFPGADLQVLFRPEIWARSALDLDLDLDQDGIAAGAPGTLAYVIYTSGSTGQPKGVMIEHRSLLCFLHWSLSIFTPGVLREVVASTSITFDISIFKFLRLSYLEAKSYWWKVCLSWSTWTGTVQLLSIRYPLLSPPS